MFDYRIHADHRRGANFVTSESKDYPALALKVSVLALVTLLYFWATVPIGTIGLDGELVVGKSDVDMPALNFIFGSEQDAPGFKFLLEQYFYGRWSIVPGEAVARAESRNPFSAWIDGKDFTAYLTSGSSATSLGLPMAFLGTVFGILGAEVMNNKRIATVFAYLGNAGARLVMALGRTIAPVTTGMDLKRLAAMWARSGCTVVVGMALAPHAYMLTFCRAVSFIDSCGAVRKCVSTHRAGFRDKRNVIHTIFRAIYPTPLGHAILVDGEKLAAPLAFTGNRATSPMPGIWAYAIFMRAFARTKVTSVVNQFTWTNFERFAAILAGARNAFLARFVVAGARTELLGIALGVKRLAAVLADFLRHNKILPAQDSWQIFDGGGGSVPVTECSGRVP